MSSRSICPVLVAVVHLVHSGYYRLSFARALYVGDTLGCSPSFLLGCGEDALLWSRQTLVGCASQPVTEVALRCFVLAILTTNAARRLFVSALAKSCDVMFDLGAHYGWYARVMGLANHGARVFAFEPDPITFSYLSRNVVDFPNVLCFSKGVGEKNSAGTLWRARTSNLNSTVRRVGPPVPITLWSLDSFCQKQGIDQSDFIKCDVEGGEVTVLHGARELLRSVKSPIWMLEVSEQFLAEAGYDPEDLLVGLKAGRSDGKLFTQDAQGNPVEIQELSQRMFGNNVFFVPEVRLGQFHSAAGALHT